MLQFRSSNRVLSDDEVIQDSIEYETSGCTCRNQFSGYRIDEGKYRVSYFGPTDAFSFFVVDVFFLTALDLFSQTKVKDWF